MDQELKKQYPLTSAAQYHQTIICAVKSHSFSRALATLQIYYHIRKPYTYPGLPSQKRPFKLEKLQNTIRIRLNKPNYTGRCRTNLEDVGLYDVVTEIRTGLSPWVDCHTLQLFVSPKHL